MTTLTYGPAPTTQRAWRWWQWLLLVLGTVLAALGAAVATVFVVLGVGTTCDTDATVSTLRQGQAWLVAIVAVGVAPGAVLAWRQSRLRWLVSAAVTVAVPLYALATMTTVADWDGVSFCF